MVARIMWPPVQRLRLNSKGRDWIVGDIHGCYDLLRRALDRVRFDPAADRLLSVGDLIDKGPSSQEAVDFLELPFVHAVRGNHEDLLIELYQDGAPTNLILNFFAKRAGFRWWLNTETDVRRRMVDAINRLPIAIELETEDGLVGVVHADVPGGFSWQQFISALENPRHRRTGDVATAAVWSRTRIRTNDVRGVAGVSRVFVGHTPLDGPRVLGNVFAIDTGAVSGVMGDEGGGSVSLVDARACARDIRRHSINPHPADMVRVIASDWPSESSWELPDGEESAATPFNRQRVQA
jgi:serine/threonine protein phosphatase 1